MLDRNSVDFLRGATIGIAIGAAGVVVLQNLYSRGVVGNTIMSNDSSQATVPSNASLSQSGVLMGSRVSSPVLTSGKYLVSGYGPIS